MTELIDKGVIHGILVEEIEMLKSLKEKTEKEYRGGFDLRIAEADSIKECIEAMPTTTEAEIRAKAFSDLIEKIRGSLELPPLALDYIRIFAEQLKEE